MRARHTAHSLPAFPVYSAAFLSDNELVLGGGGGASRSGIKNKLVRKLNSFYTRRVTYGRYIQRFYRVNDPTKIELIDEHELEKGEDAPMSMAAYPDVSPLGLDVIQSF